MNIMNGPYLGLLRWYCVLTRAGSKVVRSFSRGCAELVGRVTGCVQDAYFITCTTYCTGQYCNRANGIPRRRATKKKRRHRHRR